MTAPNWTSRTMWTDDNLTSPLCARVFTRFPQRLSTRRGPENSRARQPCAKKGRCNEFAYLKRIGAANQVPALRAVTRITLPRAASSREQ